MSFIGEQIKKYRNIKGMTQQDIADALGESSGRVIYNWEKGIGRPDCDKLAKLCDLLGVSADELIGCKSMAQRPTATEWTTLQKYRALDEHGKEVVDYMIDSEYKRVRLSMKKPKPRMLKVDFYNYPASAGTGNFLENEIPEQILVKESAEAEEADYAIPVSGDSMEPYIHDGQLVYVRRDVSLSEFDVGIFFVDGDVFCKQWCVDYSGTLYLLSANEKRQDANIVIPRDSSRSCVCFGKVLLPERLPRPIYY